jgi:hypothetical protein
MTATPPGSDDFRLPAGHLSMGNSTDRGRASIKSSLAFFNTKAGHHESGLMRG